MRNLSIHGSRVIALAAFTLTASVSQLAHAALCDDVLPDASFPHKIWGVGGSAGTPTLKAIAIQLAKLSEPITILYADPSACTGFKDFVNNSAANTFKYWDADGNENTCTQPGHSIDFSHMGNSDAWCADKLPADGELRSKDFLAPVQTLNVITDKDSSQSVISAEALYHIYGFGPGGFDLDGTTSRAVAPWTEATAVYSRKKTSFVEQFVAAAIFNDIARAPNFKVNDATYFLSTNQEVVDAVYGAKGPGTPHADPDTTLGFVSGSTVHAPGNEVVKTLAYQHYDQTCAYLPDSAADKYDNVNVRSGQYFLWTQAHLFARVDAQGKPTNQYVGNLIDWIQGNTAGPNGIDIQEIIIKSGDIPLCAMQAIRSSGDFSPIQSYAPADPCNGYYEYTLTGSTNHGACEKDADCTGPDDKADDKCRHGFCEAY